MAETKNAVATAPKQTFSVVLTEKLNGVSDALPKDFNVYRYGHMLKHSIYMDSASCHFLHFQYIVCPANQNQLLLHILRNTPWVNRVCFINPNRKTQTIHFL